MAYGQTGSGKTNTMAGKVELALDNSLYVFKFPIALWVALPPLANSLTSLKYVNFAGGSNAFKSESETRGIIPRALCQVEAMVAP